MKTISMRGLLAACSCAALTMIALPAHAGGPDVGVSVQISQPGVYGRVDIGRFPQPVIVAQQPVVVVAPPPRMVAPEPVYMWVPPEHQRRWKHHCHRYNACGRPVYFVQDDWYREHVGRDHRRDERDYRRDERDDRRDWDRGDRGDRHDGERRGHGHGHGHGHDRGRD